MSKVFISHRGADSKEAEHLARDLSAHGHDVWLDIWEIRAGDSIPDKINKGLINTEYFVLCLSSLGVDSNWISREWLSTLARQMNGLNVKLIPVILTGGGPPALLADIKYADMVSDWNRGLQQLLATLK